VPRRSGGRRRGEGEAGVERGQGSEDGGERVGGVVQGESGRVRCGAGGGNWQVRIVCGEGGAELDVRRFWVR
jgi:hypothetical protein